MRRGGGWWLGGGSRRAAQAQRAVTAAEFVTRLQRGQVADPRRAELVGGRPRHAPAPGAAAAALGRLAAEFARRAPATAHCASRPLVGLGQLDLWRPPLALLRRSGLPGSLGADPTVAAAGVLLVVEAGHEPLAERLAGYAAAGLREVWWLDLRQGWTVAYRAPWRGAYRSRTLWYPGESVPVASLPGVQVEALARGFRAQPAAGKRAR